MDNLGESAGRYAKKRLDLRKYVAQAVGNNPATRVAPGLRRRVNYAATTSILTTATTVGCRRTSTS